MCLNIILFWEKKKEVKLIFLQLMEGQRLELAFFGGVLLPMLGALGYTISNLTWSVIPWNGLGPEGENMGFGEGGSSCAFSVFGMYLCLKTDKTCIRLSYNLCGSALRCFQ